MSSAMLRFRFASQLCLLCIMIPIPKEKRCSSSNSDHYRIIAVTKLYKISDDLVIPKLTNHVNKQSHSLITITHQFGFKFNKSTVLIVHPHVLCSRILIETVQFYDENLYRL